MALLDIEVKNITNTTIDKKLQPLPSLIKHEIDNSPLIKNLASSTTQLHQAILDFQKQPMQRSTGFHQPESIYFHVSKLLI
jgi:hypothetical protein